MSNRAVETIRVCKRFGDTCAVNDVSFAVGAGEFFSLLGPSGCGKTTLLRMLAGFDSPTSGRILVAGKEMVGVPPHKRPVNMVFQSYALFPHLTVFENVAFGLRAASSLSREEIRERAGWALDLVRLKQLGDRYPAQISGGQQQRVALARAVAKHPAVLLLDEPLSALDLKIRQEMQEELARLQRAIGITFVMVTHDQGEALALSDHLAVFCNGNLEQIGSPEEIYQAPKTRFVAEFIGQTNVLEAAVVESAGSFCRVRVGDGFFLWVKNDPTAGSLAREQAVAVWIRTASLRLFAQPLPSGEDHLADEPVNRFQATVTGRSFQGTTTDYRLETGPGLVLRVSRPNDDTAFHPGDRVTVCLPAGSAAILVATAGGAELQEAPA